MNKDILSGKYVDGDIGSVARQAEREGAGVMGVAAIEACGGDGIAARWDVREIVVAGSISLCGRHRGAAAGDRHRGSRQRDWSGTVADWTCQHRATDAQARDGEGDTEGLGASLHSDVAGIAGGDRNRRVIGAYWKAVRVHSDANIP